MTKLQRDWTAFFPRLTLQRQLTLLLMVFVGLGGAAMGLLAEVYHRRESTLAARTQAELSQANALLIQKFLESDLVDSHTFGKPEDDILWQQSSQALADFPRVEGGFYLHQVDQLLGYAFPTHGGKVPKRDVPPTERGIILDLVQQTTALRVPQEKVLHAGIDIVILRAEPLPFRGAVWTMKRIPQSQDRQSRLLTLLLVCLMLVAVAWTLLILVQLRHGVRSLQHGIKEIEEGRADEIVPLTMEMGQVGAAITSMHQRRRELENRLQRVERLASLGQLVAGVAHEVRNPLASLRLNLEYLARQAQRQGNVLSIDHLTEQIDRLEALVRQLLYFDKRQQDEAWVPESLEKIVQEAVSLLRLEAQQQGIELVYQPPGRSLLPIPLRCRSLNQMMVNLILNAIQASRAGQTITVGVEEEGDYLVAWVEDAGKGVPPELKEQIFNPFVSTKPDGTGLGLSISHEIVVQHGGYIDLQSRPGCTRFSAYLPKQPKPGISGLELAKRGRNGKNSDH
ncbi:ATP-binding protein [Thermoleptolyngbya sp. C42_A2020_037]|uniref:sensor histidine kinase n=1 Tax=Thermoleptolyngbya sp. C42_A2020_037 TaxID=2747799 RepID=UPI001A0EF81D|nr:ATP-binding protein [Thermoleptolyngbya sp. C42_A2020_037]MBF2086666.1 two-component sensor histidine kinase [Thermoleptolyngbya sp. C42_A2020_037]